MAHAARTLLVGHVGGVVQRFSHAFDIVWIDEQGMPVQLRSCSRELAQDEDAVFLDVAGAVFIPSLIGVMRAISAVR